MSRHTLAKRSLIWLDRLHDGRWVLIGKRSGRRLLLFTPWRNAWLVPGGETGKVADGWKGVIRLAAFLDAKQAGKANDNVPAREGKRLRRLKRARMPS